jgi:adenylate cyclase
MLAELKVFNREQVERGEAPIAIGIGLHFGPAIVGYVGSRDRYEYSAIGDTVNVAARIEGLTKELGVPVLLSITVEQNLAIAPPRTGVGAVPLKGRSPIELFGWKPHPEA